MYIHTFVIFFFLKGHFLFSLDIIFSYFYFFSIVVKGVVCKKNVAHRRMTSRIEKPRFLILGGALEYQRVSNHLSSFDTLLQQVTISLLIKTCCFYIREVSIYLYIYAVVSVGNGSSKDGCGENRRAPT